MQATRIALRTLLNERCHVSNHLGASSVYPWLFEFFSISRVFYLFRPPFRRSLALPARLAAGLLSACRALSARFIELFNTARARAQDARAEMLTDRRGDTHNGPANRDSTTALTTDGRSSVIFAPIAARERGRDSKTVAYLRLEISSCYNAIRISLRFAATAVQVAADGCLVCGNGEIPFDCDRSAQFAYSYL